MAVMGGESMKKLCLLAVMAVNILGYCYSAYGKADEYLCDTGDGHCYQCQASNKYEIILVAGAHRWDGKTYQKATYYKCRENGALFGDWVWREISVNEIPSCSTSGSRTVDTGRNFEGRALKAKAAVNGFIYRNPCIEPKEDAPASTGVCKYRNKMWPVGNITDCPSVKGKAGAAKAETICNADGTVTECKITCPTDRPKLENGKCVAAKKTQKTAKLTQSPEPVTPASTTPQVPEKPNCESLASASADLLSVCADNNDAKAIALDAVIVCAGDTDISADVLKQWLEKIEEQKQVCTDTAAETELCNAIADAHMVDGKCECVDSSKELDRENKVCKDSATTLQAESKKKIEDIKNKIDEHKNGLNTSVWKDKNGNFNTARLASDSIAGVVLGTAGGLITSHVIKKNQLKNGFEDIKCSIGGQVVAEYGDEFEVGRK